MSESLMSEHKVIWGDIKITKEESKVLEREVVDWGGILGFAEDLKEKEKEEERRGYDDTEGETAYEKFLYLRRCFTKTQKNLGQKQEMEGFKNKKITEGRAERGECG